MQYLQQVSEVIAALGTISTIIAHLPFVPARTAAFFARFGVASSKFAVSTRVQP